jgi:hypothetical protein
MKHNTISKSKVAPVIAVILVSSIFTKVYVKLRDNADEGIIETKEGM